MMSARPPDDSPSVRGPTVEMRAGPPVERNDEWNRRFGSKSISALFAEQAARTPEAPAIRDRRGTLTYRELEAEAALLAARLRTSGVRPGQLVVLETVRSRETIVALLAVLKIGAAYLALDPDSPPERLALMLADARPALILTQTACERTLPDSAAMILNLDAELASSRSGPRPTTNTTAALSPPAPTAQDLAYVSFTSGSTGAPKGVCIPHRAVVRLVKEPDYVTVAPSDVILQFAPLSFDASTFEIWGGLLNGACLAVFPPQKPSLTDLGEFIEREKVSILWLTAGLFHQMADGHLHYLHKVRQLIAGGDVLSIPHVERTLQTLPRCRLVNGYGPTENTTFTCCHQIESLPPSGSSIPIGKPIARTYCWVLDEDGQLVETGHSGELYVGGDGLALGYLGDPALTAQKFIHDPLSQDPNARLYRTGDRVRELAGGSYEFLGRVDRQVKVSGVRIELDEIEAVLAQHPAVRETAVHLRPGVSGYKQLAAFVAPQTNATVTAAELRDFLRVRLPAYMIPSTLTFLPSLPLNANGKLDRSGLQALDGETAEARLPAAAGAGTEETLIGIWREVLGFDDFTNRENFFDLGGTSLRATHLLARIQTVLGKSVPMSVLLESGTIVELVRYLDQCPRTHTSPLYVFRSAGEKPALFCLPSYAGDLMCYANLERYFAPDRPVYGIQSRRFFGEDEGRTMEDIAASCRQIILDQQPEGPYHLFGFCFGGLLAYEVACQLWEQGAEVGLVAALDFEFPDPDPGHSWRRRPAGLLSFVGNLTLGILELFRMPRAELRLVFRRLAFRVGGLLRGESWDEALRSGLGGPQATEQERLDVIHERAWRQYVPRSFPGEVTLLRARRLPIFRAHDPTLGWSAIAARHLRVRIVGGGWHGAALKEPHVSNLTRAIESCMAEAEQMPTTPTPFPVSPVAGV